MDELGEILDGVDVVVRGWGNELDAGLGVAQAGDEGVDLVAGELAALAGLRALCHFDLQLVGVDEVVRGDAEATGGDLLDVGAGEITVRVRLVADGILAALAGIRFPADAVHGDGERLVRLRGKRTERHRGGGEAAADIFQRLHLIDWNRAGCGGDET